MENIDPMDLVKQQSRDAHLWAKSFMSLYGNRLNEIDEGLMIGWFANAMMAMYDSIHNREIYKLKQQLKRAYMKSGEGL